VRTAAAGVFVKHSVLERPEACCARDPWERRDASDRREIAWEGRVQASSRSWPVLYTPPGHAVSRAATRGAGAADLLAGYAAGDLTKRISNIPDRIPTRNFSRDKHAA